MGRHGEAPAHKQKKKFENRFSQLKIMSGPVHIVTGSAGCKEGRDQFKHRPLAWSALRSQDYGYTKFKAFNKTHVYMEQISVDRQGQSIDSFWLVKHKLRFD